MINSEDLYFEDGRGLGDYFHTDGRLMRIAICYRGDLDGEVLSAEETVRVLGALEADHTLVLEEEPFGDDYPKMLVVDHERLGIDVPRKYRLFVEVGYMYHGEMLPVDPREPWNGPDAVIEGYESDE